MSKKTTRFRLILAIALLTPLLFTSPAPAAEPESSTQTTNLCDFKFVVGEEGFVGSSR